MFGAISKFFKKAVPAPSGARSEPSGPSAGPSHAARPVSRAASQNETRSSAESPHPHLTVAPTGSDQVMQISFAGIIKQVPKELWGKLAPAGVAGASFPVFMQQVLEQLPQGSVKIPFGELRTHAPAGVFTANAAQDARLIDLPLQEILAQLHPDNIARRPDQVCIEVSEDVPDIFGNRGESYSAVRVLDQKEANHTSMMSRQRASSPASAVEATIPTRSIQASNPLQQPVSFQQPPPQAQAAPPRSSPTASPFPPQNRATPPPAQARAIPTPAPAPMVNPLAGGHSIPFVATPAAGRPPITAPISAPQPAAAPAKPAAARPLPKATPAAPAPTMPGVFYISLNVVAANWPDGIRQELAQLKIPDAKVGLPPVDICEGLKRRRIQYPWRTIRSWIEPTPLYPVPSPYDDEVLELPLQKLTPLFLEYIRANPVNRRTAEADNITAFFRKAEETAGTTPEAAATLLQPEAPAAPVPVVTAFNPATYAFQPPATPAPARVPAPKAAPAPPAPPAVAAPSKEGCLALVIGQISKGWPEPVLQDIQQFNLNQSTVLVPLASIETGLKTGRVEFTWRELCAWLDPQSPPAQHSLNGDNRVSLPLSLVAPQFMKARGNAGERRKVNVDQQIPDLFNAAGKPTPAAPAPEAAPHSPSPVAAPQTAPVAAPAVKKKPTSLNELFNEPDKRNWSPNDIVHKSATLPGVAGALIALQDGLLVAACMPPEARTETIAAFVPQIFGRMNQYSKELQMGDCNSIALTVEEGTLHIFSAGIIYYAALSKPGELLPMLEIQLIASELSRHTK